jgi:hypothetical protein
MATFMYAYVIARARCKLCYIFLIFIFSYNKMILLIYSRLFGVLYSCVVLLYHRKIHDRIQARPYPSFYQFAVMTRG